MSGLNLYFEVLDMNWSFVQLHGYSPREHLMRSYIIKAIDQLELDSLFVDQDGNLAKAAMDIHCELYSDDTTEKDYQILIDKMKAEQLL